MAISANGIIATSDGSEDFLSHQNWIQFVGLVKQVGSIIWGRKTYEEVSTWPAEYFDSLENVTKIVVSENLEAIDERFVLVKSPEEALKYLSQHDFDQTVITGGSTINSYFAQKKLIDEVILNVNPSLVGRGIPLFKPKDFLIDLKLISCTPIGEDIIELHYQLNR